MIEVYGKAADDLMIRYEIFERDTTSPRLGLVRRTGRQASRGRSSRTVYKWIADYDVGCGETRVVAETLTMNDAILAIQVAATNTRRAITAYQS